MHKLRGRRRMSLYVGFALLLAPISIVLGRRYDYPYPECLLIAAGAEAAVLFWILERIASDRIRRRIGPRLRYLYAPELRQLASEADHERVFQAAESDATTWSDFMGV